MDGGNVEEQPTERKTYADIFDECCSMYISYGMTYQEYWFGNPEIAKYYRDAHTLKNKARNQELWLQGKYFIYSIAVALDPKGKAKYPTEPFDIYPKTEAEQKPK